MVDIANLSGIPPLPSLYSNTSSLFISNDQLYDAMSRQGASDEQIYREMTGKKSGKEKLNDAIDTIKKVADGAEKAAKVAAVVANPGAAIAAGAANAVGNGVGIGGGCGSLDFVCKLREWFEETDFIRRMAFVIIGLLMVGGGIVFFAKGEASRVISTVKG